MNTGKLQKTQSAELTRTFTEADVQTFAELSGDHNRIHLDEQAAKKSIFGKKVVHGMLAASLISAVIGTLLPGEGTIYLEQSLKFLAPVFPGDAVTARVSVDDIINVERGIYRLGTKVTNQDNQIVIDGYAVIKYL